AKSEESERPKSKSLEMNPLLLQVSKPSQTQRKTSHSATLVKITDQLGNFPFGVVYRPLALSIGIVVLWVIGRYSTISRKFSGSTHWNKRRVRPFGDSPSGHSDPQGFIFFVLFSLFISFCEDVSNSAIQD
ncbi:hypothetical protein H5410_027801, partial [Solanum commersonii]